MSLNVRETHRCCLTEACPRVCRMCHQSSRWKVKPSLCFAGATRSALLRWVPVHGLAPLHCSLNLGGFASPSCQFPCFPFHNNFEMVQGQRQFSFTPQSYGWTLHCKGRCARCVPPSFTALQNGNHPCLSALSQPSCGSVKENLLR